MGLYDTSEVCELKTVIFVVGVCCWLVVPEQLLRKEGGG